MKILVTGVCGQLGHDVIKEILCRGHTAVGTDLQAQCDDGTVPSYISLDITDKNAVEKAVLSGSFDAVIHCAAWTAVDKAEEQQYKDTVFAVNGRGTENIALACKKCGAKMLYFSTDYVFSGEGTAPYKADCKDFNPLNVYGRSKLQGELAVEQTLDRYFIVRIAWVFGANGNNFVNTMLRLAKNHDRISVVNDQIGTPTYSRDLARLIADMIETDKYGRYNATNEGGYISWYDFAVEIFAQSHTDVQVIPVSTGDYGFSKAKRPYNSRLDKSKLATNGFTPLPGWRDALSRYLQEIGEKR